MELIEEVNSAALESIFTNNKQEKLYIEDLKSIKNIDEDKAESVKDPEIEALE